MMRLLIALLALPAALASPVAGNTAREVVADHLACTCKNAAGNSRASGICQARSGSLVPNGAAPSGEEWVNPRPESPMCKSVTVRG
jgi:hypothetical protein